MEQNNSGAFPGIGIGNGGVFKENLFQSIGLWDKNNILFFYDYPL
jgi:hypothetical protein